jgi:uncharacterized protein YbcI
LNLTKGQLEAKISEAVSKFEIEFMGRGPKEIRTIINQELIIIRLNGFLNQSEKKLAESGTHGVKLVKDARTALFESGRDYLIDLIQNIINIDIISIHSDVSTRTGERIIVFTIGANLEAKFKK